MREMGHDARMTTAVSRGWVPDGQTFGARLALVRYTMGWNLKEAALACGFSATTWRGWELSGHVPRDFMDKAHGIARTAGCDVQWLIGIDHGPFEGRADVEVLMTTREVADQLRVHPGTVRRWLSDGLLPVVTLPSGQKRVRRADVDALLASHFAA
jgi:excisionase family DNA binding protein